MKKYHIVSENETMWAIAKKYYGEGKEYTKICKANNITNPDAIKIGDKLMIPTLSQTDYMQVLESKECSFKNVCNEYKNLSKQYKEIGERIKEARNNIIDKLNSEDEPYLCVGRDDLDEILKILDGR